MHCPFQPSKEGPEWPGSSLRCGLRRGEADVARLPGSSPSLRGPGLTVPGRTGDAGSKPVDGAAGAVDVDLARPVLVRAKSPMCFGRSVQRGVNVLLKVGSVAARPPTVEALDHVQVPSHTPSICSGTCSQQGLTYPLRRRSDGSDVRVPPPVPGETQHDAGTQQNSDHGPDHGCVVADVATSDTEDGRQVPVT